MKILAVGDPHGDRRIFDIPIGEDIDAVFITGDLGKSDLIRKYHFEYVIKKGLKTWKEAISKEELEKVYLEIINSSYEVLKYFCSKKPTFYVLGNLREIRTENIIRDSERFKLSLPLFEDKVKGLKNLRNIGLSTMEFKGLKIGGIPYFESLEWVKEFSPKNEKLLELAKKEEPPIEKYIETLPQLDILLTHIPPYNILDEVKSEHVPKDWMGKHAGNRKILNYIKKNKPKLVLCGHIHESKGKQKLGRTEIYNLGSSGEYEIIEI